MAVSMCTYGSKYMAVKFEVPTAVLPKILVFWDVTLCHCVSGSQHFYKSKCLTLKLKEI
jgi:hypothetical protein